MEFWDLFVLQWHGVLLSAGAFGGDSGASSSFSDRSFAVDRCFCCWCGSQVGVGGMGILLSAAAFGAEVAGSNSR